MEDVLEIYQRPEDAATPVVCVDETSKQQIQETRHPLPMACGIPSRYDSHYQRNGVSNLFMIFSPLLGFRHVEVTDKNFAHICRDLVDVHFPEAEKSYWFAIISILINPLQCIKRFRPMKPDALLKSWHSTTPRSMGVG